MAAKTNNSKTKGATAKDVKQVNKASAAKAKPAAQQPAAAKAKVHPTARKTTDKPAAVKSKAMPAHKPAAAKPAHSAAHAAAKPAHRPAHMHAPSHVAQPAKPAVHAAPAHASPTHRPATPAPAVHSAHPPAAHQPAAHHPAPLHQAAHHTAGHPPVKTAPTPVLPPRPVLAAGHRPAGSHSPMGHKRSHNFHGQPMQLPRDVIERNPTLKLDPNKKKTLQRHGFRTSEYVVYPSHGVGKIVAIEEQVVAGHALELFVINFEQEKMTLRVPTAKLAAVGMRKLSEDGIVRRAMETLKGRARIKRTMWSRRAQEYENKINSGDLVSISEVVRDLYRAETQPEQSYSERQLFEAALDRMSREIAAIEKLDDRGAVQKITEVLSKSARGRAANKAAEDAAAAGEASEGQAA